MMSKGPCSCLRLFQSGWRSIVAAVDLLGTERKHEDMAKPFSLQTAQRAPQLLRLVPNHMRPELPIRPSSGCAPGRAVPANPARSPRAAHETPGPARPAACALPAARWSHRRPSDDPLPVVSRDEVQHLKGIVGRALIVLVVGNQARGRSRTKNLGRLEVLLGQKWICRIRTLRSEPPAKVRES